MLAGIQNGIAFLLDCHNISSSRIVSTGASHRVLLCVYNRRCKLAPRAGAGCNGQAERPIGSDHGKTRFYNNCHRYCRSRGQITEHPKGNGAWSGTESLCPREHAHSGKCSEVNSGHSPKFFKKLEKFGEVWRVWRKVVRSLEWCGLYHN